MISKASQITKPINNKENQKLSMAPQFSQPKFSSIKKNFDRNREQDYQKSIYYNTNVNVKYTPETKPFKFEETREFTVTKQKDRNSQNLEAKIQSIMKHNSTLLNENATLSELLNQRNGQIEILEKKLEEQIQNQVNNLNMIKNDRDKLVGQIQQKNREKQEEFEKLQDQIQRLYNKISQLQNQRTKQINFLKESLIRESNNQIETLKLNQMNNIENYQMQIRKYKDSIDQKNFQISSQQHQNKIKISKLEQQVSQLTSELKFIKQIHNLQLQESKIHYQNMINNMTREFAKSKQIEMSNFQSEKRKIKKELNDRISDIEKLSAKISQNNEQNQFFYQFMKQDKNKLQYQLLQMEINTKQFIKEEKEKTLMIHKLQIENLVIAHNTFVQTLKSENQKLIQICETKKLQIQSIHNQVNVVKKQCQEQINDYKKLIKNLKQKLEEKERYYIEENELLKVKLGVLHSGDIESLKECYESHIKKLSVQLLEKQQIIQQNRQKLYEQLSQRSRLRKNFQLQIEKQKNKVIELNLKISKLTQQMKHNLNELNQKLDDNQQNHIKQVQSKSRDNSINQQEKRKLYELINSKDKEIEYLNQKISRLKNQAERQIQLKKKEVKQLKQKINSLLERHNKQLDSQKEVLLKKQTQLNQLKINLENELSNVKSRFHNEMKQEIKKVQTENIQTVKLLENSQRQKQSLTNELNIKNNIIQDYKKQIEIIVIQERDKFNKLIESKQLKLKQSYELQILSKNKQIEQLQHTLNERQMDISQLTIKYNIIEKNIIDLLETTQSLRQFENKVVNIGQDNNLMKNLSQLFKNREI